MTDQTYIPGSPATTDRRLERIETTNAQLVALFAEVSAKLDVLIAQGDEQTSMNRSMAHFTQMLTGGAKVDEPEARPGFEDYRENDAGDGWEVKLKYPDQVANWYPATASEVQTISEMNARRVTKPRRTR